MKISLGPISGVKRPNSLLGGAISHQDKYEFISLSVAGRNEWANAIQAHCDYYKKSH